MSRHTNRNKAKASKADSESDQTLSPASEQASNIKYKYNRKKDKEPRRNKSAFIIFSNHTRLKLKEQNTDSLNANEMMIKLAELWKNLSKEEKRPYETEAVNDKVRYQQELEAFSKENPSRLPENRTKNNHIKKPCSAYGVYLREMKNEVKAKEPGLKMADVLKIVSKQWKNLGKKEREIYEEMAKKQKQEVHQKLGEHLLKIEENAAKRNAQKQYLVKKKLKSKGLSLINDLVSQSDATAVVTNCNSDELSLSSSTSERKVDTDIIIKFEPSMSVTEPIQAITPLNEEPKSSDKACFIEMLDFNSTYQTLNDDNIDFFCQTNVKTEPNPFIVALEFEMQPLLDFDLNEDFSNNLSGILEVDDMSQLRHY